ncbi:MAG: YncE family protein, partial [Acidobacteriota bacterium]|nr:YncE family protein [Acidobacteriota bacterium]
MRLARRLGMGLGLLLYSSLTLVSVQAQSGWHVERTIQIGGIGGMDYLTVDSANHLLYVPRSTHTLVIDAVSGKTMGDIPGQKVAHGVAIVPKLNRGFITDGGGTGSVTVFDLKTNVILGILKALPDADGIIYDPGTDRILVSAGDS